LLNLNRKVAGRYLKHYIELIRPRFLKGQDSGYVFLSKQGEQLCSDSFSDIVKKHAKTSGIAKNIFPHCFRASGLTHMLRNGANVRHLMEIAGHAHMDSLNPYLQVEISDIKETHANTHPRELEGDR
jgi:integrase/recombinase XerD